MITVNKFEISNDRLSIDVQITVEPGDTVTDLKFWNDSNYKITTQAVDLNSKISGATNVETFTITSIDAIVSSFDGLYFMEIHSSGQSAAGIVGTMSLVRYYNVMAKLLANISLSCLNCNNNFQNAILLDLYVEAMKQAIILGRFRDSIEVYRKVVIFTEEECPECCEVNPVVSTAGNIVSIGVIDCQLSLL